MKKYAVIVAAGIGSRMNSETPKQFLLIKNKPVLFYTIDTFLKAFDDLQIILVLSKENIERGKKIIEEYFDKAEIKICGGGETRFHSVKNGLSLIKDESIIFVHDGVRCMVTKDLIQRCYNQAKSSGSAIPVISSKDSVRLITENGNKTFDRNKVKLVQTPQTFASNLLLPAFITDYDDRFTDEATVVEASGIQINLIEGEENNIKITTPADLFFAEKIINNDKQNKNRLE
jgi:2-C-methyl-D-erythritol 4-phosphate cytidylyltransferase